MPSDLPITNQPLLHVEDLVVSFKTDEGVVRAVDHVSFDVFKGEVVGIVGESGCGKSVTAMSLLRLIPQPPGRIEKGIVRFKGQDLLTMPVEALRRIRGKEIGIIFQEPMTALSPLHRIGNQLVEALQFHSDISKKSAWETGVRWLKKVGIPDAADRMYAYPHELSGGMRQRVMIAMVLMLEPALIIADEPTTALDVTIQSQILNLLLETKKSETAIIFITHNLGVIWEICTRMMVMYASEIVESGPVEDVFSTPGHPYTAALLKANPALAERNRTMDTIPGQVPSPYTLITGCRFYDRCALAHSKCRPHPIEYALNGNRRVRCVLFPETQKKVDA